MVDPRDDGLRACPFCGGSDLFVERATLSDCYVICNDCGAKGPDSCDETEADAEASENGDCEPGELPARRLWNTRPEPLAESGVAGVIGALRRAKIRSYSHKQGDISLEFDRIEDLVTVVTSVGTAPEQSAHCSGEVVGSGALTALARALANDPAAREVAGQQNADQFDDMDAECVEYWFHIARAALAALGARHDNALADGGEK